MDKLVASGVGQAILPLLGGVASAASPAMARGVHGFGTSAYLMNKMGKANEESQRLKTITDLIPGLDFTNPSGIQPWVPMMQHAPSVSSLNTLISAFAGTREKPKHYTSGTQLLEIPPGGGSARPIYDSGPARLSQFGKEQEIKDKFQRGRMDKAAKINKEFTAFQMSFAQRIKDAQAGKRLTPREAHKWLMDYENQAKTQLVLIQNLPYTERKQAEIALNKELARAKALLEPIAGRITPSGSDPAELFTE